MWTPTRGGLRTGAAALVKAALAVALLAGCAGGGAPWQTPPRTIAVTPPPGERAAVVEARVGDTVVVTLEANATTGYAWTFTAGDTFAIEGDEYVPDPNPGGIAGKGGRQVVTLRVVRAGESDLTGTYARAWETPAAGARPDVVVTLRSTD